ncbi:NAD-dependent epimerase/dehydratase family protein [Phreatobacter aquaticus]|uniref:NAD-dependent epimerase/dehydratase family protein n=2 Tax=Phreatobacter aquaticus TaxID=2570229 RepID=A0A4D7QLZ0_9HYPH|nr:NAD-dependent epimerase/dehydratase family protein [Phreatobacter aquaticus]
MNKLLDGQNILVTGGTGSLGQALVRRIFEGGYGEPERVLVFSRDEAKQHDMRTAFQRKDRATDDLIYRDHSSRLRFRIGDVRSQADLARAIDGIDMIIHAAALKQVPSCEYFPEQAIDTNCLGAINLVEALRSRPNKVQVVVGLSTDKACQPTNVMGMTKALQERILVAANLVSEGTRFVAVRYGNIVASRGSVIPLFLEQIRSGNPVTLTSEKMTRFLMPSSSAVETIFEAIKNARAGEIVVRTAPSVRMTHVVKALLRGRPIPIRITGIRPGEKLHETLITHEEAERTVRMGEFIFLAPMLPEFLDRRPQTDLTRLQTELSSNSDVLDFDETVSLMKAWQVDRWETEPA